MCIRDRSRASDAMRFAITAFILRATKMNKVHMHHFLFGGGGWNAVSYTHLDVYKRQAGYEYKDGKQPAMRG